jgi:hypothetical protein
LTDYGIVVSTYDPAKPEAVYKEYGIKTYKEIPTEKYDWF